MIPFLFHRKVLKDTNLPVDKLTYWTPRLFCLVILPYYKLLIVFIQLANSSL